MMRRSPATLAWCAFAAATSVAGATAADLPTGGAYITTLPSGADIWIDGTYVGRSPLLVDALLPGNHAVSIVRSGWAGAELLVAVVPGNVAMSSTRLAPAARQPAGSASGTLVIRDAPGGATLVLDGEPLARHAGTSLSLGAGTHRLTLVGPRGRTTRVFSIYPQTTTDVVLREKSDRSSRFAVVAPAEDYLPTDAFSVDGTKIVVRYDGHVVVGHFGETAVRFDGAPASYDGAPESIGGKLYLPLELLEKLTGDTSKSR